MSRFIVICFMALFSLHVQAQELLPSVRNFTSGDYKAASQNWGVSSDSLGIVYVANNEGLLTYDGERWSRYKLPNETIIRSVFAVGEKIFTGSYEEFGYWAYDTYGELHYTSLTHLIDSDFDNEEFWEIKALGDQIVFRSFGKLYLYGNGTIKSFKPDFLITSLLVKDEKLYVGGKDGQVYEFDKGSFDPLTENGLPGGYSVTCLTSYKDTLVVGSRVGGLYRREGQDFVQWGTQELNAFLIKNELNKTSAFDAGHFAFGTIKGGIITYNTTTGKTTVFRLGNGLQNNTVLALHTCGNRLWASLDNGVDAVDLNAPIRFYRDRTGELGAVYDIAFAGQKIYLGSNTGVHLLDRTGQSFIPGSQGQVWSFNTIDEELYVNHNHGIYKIIGDQIVAVDTRTGSYGLTSVPGESRFYLDATYNGIAVYEKRAGTLKYSRLISALDTPVKNLAFETENELWAAHPYKGFYKIDFSLDSVKPMQAKRFVKDTLLRAYKTNIYRLPGNTIAFYNAGSWFRYNNFKAAIEPLEEMDPYTGYSLISDEPHAYWLKNTTGPGLIFTDFKSDSLFVESDVLEDRLVKGNSRAIAYHGDYYMTLNEGFAVIDMEKLRRRYEKQAIGTPRLMRISSGKNVFSRIWRDFKLSYEEAARLNIEVASPNIQNAAFSYTLSTGENGRLNGGTLLLRNLSTGKNTLKIVPMANGRPGDHPLILTLEVLPPWYLGAPMLIGYILVLFGIVFLIYLINRRKLNKHRLAVEQRITKEQERKMELAERRALMEEIENKRKELANSTYLAAQRNKALTEIKDDLQEVDGQAGSRQKLREVEGKIAQMIEGKDHWKVFETNFKELNDTFFQDLLKEHPKLSAKDLKLCAYLKMNLSTKEIAPLMAISPRGVEIHRYRLRKKLKLKTKTNLTKYLIEHY